MTLGSRYWRVATNGFQRKEEEERRRRRGDGVKPMGWMHAAAIVGGVWVGVFG